MTTKQEPTTDGPAEKKYFRTCSQCGKRRAKSRVRGLKDHTGRKVSICTTCQPRTRKRRRSAVESAPKAARKTRQRKGLPGKQSVVYNADGSVTITIRTAAEYARFVQRGEPR